MIAGRRGLTSRVAAWTTHGRHVVAIVTLVSAAACSGSGSDDGSGEQSSASTTTVSPEGQATTGSAPPPPSGAPGFDPLIPGSTPPSGATRPITIAFAGDSYGEGLSGDVAAGMIGRLSPMAPVLSAADLAVLNLETAITERGEPVPKSFTFRAPASILDGIALSGVDAVSVANNHGMDYGEVGLMDSLDARVDSPIPVVGIGVDETDALSPARFSVEGTSVAVIAATQVLDDSVLDSWTATPSHAGLASAKRVEELEEAVEEATADADVVIVFLHWGIETETCPSAVQAGLAETLAAAGASAVVGGHAHRLQAGGFLDSTYVHYGLGNFAFKARSEASAKTGVLTLTFAGGRVTDEQWTPGEVRDSSPHPLEGDDAARAVDEWESLRGCAGLAAAPG